MKRIFLLFCVLIPMFGFGAESSKEWKDGMLSWQDFQGIPMEGIHSYMKAGLSFTPKEIKGKSKPLYKLEAVAKMDCDRSFAADSQRTELRLRYHQLQFDILELLRRKLQNDLNSGMSAIQANEKVKYYNTDYLRLLNQLDTQTNNGTDDHKLQEHEYYWRKQLDEIGLPQIPIISLSPFSYGMYLGTGAILPTGGIKDDFSGSWAFSAGLTFGYDRLRFKSDITYSQPKIKELNILAVDGQKAIGTYASYLGVSVSLGYSILTTQRLTITPNVGGYWSSYSWNVGNFKMIDDKETMIGTESPQISNFNWCVGLDFDFRLFASVSQSPFFLTGKREQFNSILRLSPFLAKAKYNEANIKGYQIGITLSYLGLARSLGIK